VDFKLRREMLSTLKKAAPEELLQNWPDGRIKMFLAQRILQFRKEQDDLFRQGNYLPVTVSGEFADCCVAFARELAGKWVVVLAPRLSSRVGFPPIGEKWRESTIELPETLAMGKAREIFTGREIRSNGRTINVADAMAVLPFAAMTNL